MAKPPTFASLEGLLDQGQREGFDFRPTLLRVLTDLYLQKPAHPAADERHYTELALRLINSTDVPARAAVAERLARYPAAPRTVILRLARDVIDVAGPILRDSPGLTPADLELIMLECGAAHAAIIATRLRRQKPQASKPPVEVRDDRTGAQATELSELFLAAGGAERRDILLNLDYAAPVSPRATPAPADEVIRRLEAAALAHNVEAFGREVEIRLRHLEPAGAPDRARRARRTDRGDPQGLAGAARRAGAHPAVRQSAHRAIRATGLRARDPL